MKDSISIAVIGGGAAGCFCAIEVKRHHPESRVCIYEAASRPMLKLARTGGGRCNLTNSFRDVERLSQVYPRGEQLMKRALAHFGAEDAMRWFEAQGVRLCVQDDQRVFPISGDAMQVVRCLERAMRISGVELNCEKRLTKIETVTKTEQNLQSKQNFMAEHTENESPRYKLSFADGSEIFAQTVVVTIGGNNSQRLASILPEQVAVTQSVPSLFTFKIAEPELRALMGTVVPCASLTLAGTKFKSSAPLLITDWGLSGPVVLRLSSYAARHLAQQSYNAALLVNWLAISEAEIRELLSQNISQSPRRQLISLRPTGLSERLWEYILRRAAIQPELRWSELSPKAVNKLVGIILSDSYHIVGRAAFKEEFVTCGGVDLAQVKLSTLESRCYAGLFFAGEVLDVDAITGGFNLQAAWSSAKLVADAI